MANTGRSLHLKQVGHGLNQNDIRTGLHGRAHLLGEQIVRLIEAHGAKRCKQRARRADISNRITRTGVAHADNGGREHLAHRGGVAEFARIGAERVRGDCKTSRFDVLAMNRGHFIGAVQAQKFRQFARLKARCLQHGAHSAVENQILLARNHACKIIIGNAQRVTRIGGNSMRSYR